LLRKPYFIRKPPPKRNKNLLGGGFLINSDWSKTRKSEGKGIGKGEKRRKNGWGAPQARKKCEKRGKNGHFRRSIL
jgi:hypothetical protein